MTTLSRVFRRAPTEPEPEERSIISPMDRRSPVLRTAVIVAGVLVLIALLVSSAGPLVWILKAATSTSSDTLAEPFALWPSGIQWQYFGEAWGTFEFGNYLRNTLIVCLGSWFFGVFVATTGGYGITVLRPKYAKLVFVAVLATLFIPGVISLVGLYLTVVNVPIVGGSLINTFWAVWLPASASAFNVLLYARALEAIPRDLFDAARIDGANSWRVFRSIALPLTGPIIGVISLLSIIGAYKDFLWPLLVLPRNDVQPLSVALPRLAEGNVPLSVYMAALAVSVAIPIAMFLIFQKQFLRAAGSAGAIKE